MSQSSQTSSFGFSQETLDMIWGVNANEYPTAPQFESTPPVSLHLTDGNMHENLEMNLEAVAFWRPEVPAQGSQSLSLGSHHFSQANSMLNLQMSPHENGDLCHSLKKEPEVVTPPPESMMPLSPSIPRLVVSNTDFPGNENFWVGFPEEKTFPSKSAQWTYSNQLEKLFAKMKCMVPFRIGTEVPPPPGSYLQVVIIFKRPEHYREVAERCPNHVTRQKDGHPAPMHIMRCDHPSTCYTTCPSTGRHYLGLPFSKPAEGNNFVQEMFQFMCFGSCPGGLNRRPVQCIFTLEFSGKVLGRRAIDIRVCACPGRDRMIEETSDNKRRTETESPSVEEPATPPTNDNSPQMSDPNTPTSITPGPASPTQQLSTSTEELPKLTKKRSNQFLTSGFEVKSVRSKKHKPDESDDELFTIQVRGREKYEMLLKVKEGLDLMDLMPQAQIDAYRASCAPSGLSRTIQAQQQQSESQQSTDSNESECVGTPPTSSQMMNSSDSSGAHSSSQSSQPPGVAGAVRFVLRRTVSLERKGYH